MGIVVHTFNARTQEAEINGPLRSRIALLVYSTGSQPSLVKCSFHWDVWDPTVEPARDLIF